MLATSAEYQRELIRSGPIATKAELLVGGAVVREFDIIGGSVTVNGRDAVRRRGSVSLVDPDDTLTPSGASSLLSPLGNEIRLWRGYHYGKDGQPELFPLLTGGLRNVDVDDSPDGLVIKLDAYDRGQRVQRARFTGPYFIAKGTSVSTAISTLIRNRMPFLREDELRMGATRFTTPALTLGLDNDKDPWEAAQKLALDIGYELFFDGLGALNFRLVPDYSQASPAWTYREGEDATILQVQRSTTSDDVFSRWIVIGTTSSNETSLTYRGEAVDDNPASDTYYLGPFGDIPDETTSSNVFSNDQAQSAAEARKNLNLGLAELVHFSIVPNAAHQEGDVVFLDRERSKVNGVYILEDFTVPMVQTASMAVTTRVRRI